VCDDSQQQKILFDVLLDSLSYLSIFAVHVGVGWVICHRWTFFFSFSSPKNYNLTLFAIGILFLVLILLISNFCSWLFYISFFFCFKFHHLISIYYTLFFQFDLHSFEFLWSFAKLIFIFNFALQSNFCLYVLFQIWSFFLLFFFPFVKLTFLLNLTLQSKKKFIL
jgi:hypothetical protein